MKAFTDSI